MKSCDISRINGNKTEKIGGVAEPTCTVKA